MNTLLFFGNCVFSISQEIGKSKMVMSKNTDLWPVELQYILEKEAKKRMRFENQSDIVELQHKTNGKEAQIS